MLELIFEFLGELLLQAFGEMLVELGLLVLPDNLVRPPWRLLNLILTPLLLGGMMALMGT